MCALGYQGIACTVPAPGYGMSDTTAFSFSRCPSSRLEWMFQLAYVLGRDILIYAVAVTGAYRARKGKKRSSVLLNQAMSFGTVAATCFMAVMETRTFASIREGIRNGLYGVGLLVDAVQGQDSGGISTGCLAAYVGFAPNLLLAHTMRSVMPLLLVIGGCLVDPWLSLVVGTNCFLPAFCGYFGRYLLAYRVTPTGPLQLDNLPQGSVLAPLAVVSMIAACFCGAVWLWGWAASSKAKPLPIHVVYLASSYKEEYASWETERLVRKMSLSLVRTVFPVTLVPGLQLGSIAIILAVSSFLYATMQPYKEPAFNLLESGLLLSALIMTMLSDCVVSEDDNVWASNEATQMCMLSMVVALATMGTAIMIALVARSMYREQTQKEEDAT
ncbi:ANKRD50 [Symbiodinium pilosum]|uniref:ANKRD50 protein n=1 Tax=Symbiodinium pilosum TaxID=2952 RepID=A0A812YEK1_SYMPI|nr:ANKRD50 [Symbiodinium pilosum]